MNQTELGRHFGISAVAVGKKLSEVGLRDLQQKEPTELAKIEGYCRFTPMKDGTPFYLWNKEKVAALFRQAGMSQLSKEEVEARATAEQLIELAEQAEETGIDKFLYFFANDIPRREYPLVDRFLRELSIKAAAQELGVREETLRRWEQAGKITSERTMGGHRRYDLGTLRLVEEKRERTSLEQTPSARVTIGYARVSSPDQVPDLQRQIGVLEIYCATKGWSCEIVQDRGSGLNYRKRGLRQLITRICSGAVARLVLTHQDRLMRFGAELVFALCEHFGTEVIIINAVEERSFEEDLVQDVLEIITVFSARLYGSRSHKNKQVMQQLQEVADEIGRQDQA